MIKNALKVADIFQILALWKQVLSPYTFIPRLFPLQNNIPTVVSGYYSSCVVILNKVKMTYPYFQYVHFSLFLPLKIVLVKDINKPSEVKTEFAFLNVKFSGLQSKANVGSFDLN